MYVNAFWLGVGVTIGIEAIVMILIALFINRR